jgi:alkanesulfonate monooxygenase SsuD/methylene tetrahydromethanopterin reductase-like flavin-dependent oxidoreductase (luciferase family)
VLVGEFQVGLVLPLNQLGPDRTTVRWTAIRAMAERAEALGFDTIWVPDELVWFHEGRTPQGAWDGVSMAGAVAAVTTTAQVGTWVLSALHRNPGIIAKTVETLDEISGGRFVFGLGAGHAWPGQARAFGLPEDAIFARFEEALEIIVPLLRDGRAEYEGRYHAARGLVQAPLGPRLGRIPLMIGGNGPKGQRHAVRHADIWSAYVEEQATVEEVGPRIAMLEAICAEEGRDPGSIGRSIGVFVNPLVEVLDRPALLSGPPERIAERVATFRDAGYTRAELMLATGDPEAVDALAPMLAMV